MCDKSSASPEKTCISKIPSLVLTITRPGINDTLSNLYLRHSCRLQCNPVYRLSLALVGHSGIDLRGSDVLVAEHVLHGIDTGACLDLERTESMAARMVGDVLGDAGIPQPFLQRCLGQTVVKALEHLVRRLPPLVIVIETYQVQRLIADGVVDQLLSLLHTEGDVHAAIAVWLDPVPCQLLDVALPESCQTGEEEGLPQHFRSARSVGKPYQFLPRQVFLLRWYGVYAVKEPVGVLHNPVLPVSSVEDGTEG